MADRESLPDQEARQKALLNHAQSYLVEAGAGSGKTALLAGRVVLLLAAGIPAAEIVAITFTEAAASELRERIERYLDQLVRGEPIPPELALAFVGGVSPLQAATLIAAQASLDEITCTTIHGFCQKLIRPYPVELGLDPGAQILDETTAGLMREELLLGWLTAQCQEPEDDAAATMVRTYLRRTGADAISLLENVGLRLVTLTRGQIGPESGSPQAALRELQAAISELQAWYQGVVVSLPDAAEVVQQLGVLSANVAQWVDAIATDDGLLDILLQPAPVCVKKSDPPNFYQWRKKGAWAQAAAAAGATQDLGKRHSEQFAGYYDRCAAAYKAGIEATVDAINWRLLLDFQSYLTAYGEQKRQSAGLDFDDLLRHARRLVVEYPAIRGALSQKYRRILVDEFQDTDPLQAEILWYLCGEGPEDAVWHERQLRPGSLFLVGDPKQAIYGFRGADLAIYLQAKQSLLSYQQAEVLEVSANFRSSTAIVEFVNATFEPLLQPERQQPGFVALHATRPANGEQRGPAVVALSVSFETQDLGARGYVSTELARRQEALAVAQAVEDLLGSATVWDGRKAQFRACRPGDIALLAPKGTALWVYERAFHDRGLPIVSQAGKGFFQRQEIHDLIALLRALSSTQDTLALGALLRGPLIGLSEHELADEIVALRQRVGDERATITLTTELEGLQHPILRQTLSHLQALQRVIHRCTPFALLSQALERFHIRSIVRARDRGAAERSLSNIDQFLEIARAYDARGTVEFAREMAEKWQEATREQDAIPDLEAGAVALVTMHHAKGLEWPIVIPVNCCSGRRSGATTILQDSADGTVHVSLGGYRGQRYEQLKEELASRQDQEAIRLWYVTCTRARDLLVLPRQVLPDGGRPVEGDWLSLLELQPDGLPQLPPQAPVRLVIDPPPDVGNQQSPVVWQAEQSRIKAACRSLHIIAPSRHEAGVLRPSLAAPSIKGGRERGVMIHLLLEEVLHGVLAETQTALESRALELLAQAGLETVTDPQEGYSAVEMAATALRTLQHIEIMPLRAQLVPEVPLCALVENGEQITLVDGVVDAVVYALDGSVDIVVDWKSDIQPHPAQAAEYREQVRHYLKVTSARRGLIVYMTSGETEWLQGSREHLQPLN